MSAFLTPEFLTLIGSSLTGFLFKFWAEKRQDQKEIYERIKTRFNICHIGEFKHGEKESY